MTIGKDNPKLWAIVMIVAAVIGCIGVLGAALIRILPDLIRDTSPPLSTATVPENVKTTEPIPQATFIVTECPSPSSYARNSEPLTPGMSITGPATIHPYEETDALAKSLGLSWVPRWGINIPSGTNIQIPEQINLPNGKSYTPDGYVDFYADDARMEAGQKCWLLNNP